LFYEVGRGYIVEFLEELRVVDFCSFDFCFELTVKRQQKIDGLLQDDSGANIIEIERVGSSEI